MSSTKREAPSSSASVPPSIPPPAPEGADPVGKRRRRDEKADGAAHAVRDAPAEESSCISAFPPEVIAAIAGCCCRSTLNALMLTSTRIRDICQDERHVSKPWPTKRGCSLVEALCPDHSNLPVESSKERYDEFSRPTNEYLHYLQELRGVTPLPARLVMLHDSLGPSYIVVRNHGIMHPNWSDHIKPWTLNVWSKDCGLVYEEYYPFWDTKPTITPPLGECKSQFLMIAARRDDDPGLRVVDLNPALQCRLKSNAEEAAQSFHLPTEYDPENIRCIGGEDGTRLIFMDRTKSAVKISRIALVEEEMPGGGSYARRLTLSEPEVVLSDPARTGDHNTRRSSLASFSTSKWSIIAFAYDMEDRNIIIYDMSRRVSVSIPTPEGAGWIRDLEFSPDGKKLVVLHCTIRYTVPKQSRCSISVYDCDVDRIECIAQRPPKFFTIKEEGWCSDVTFSPKGTKIAVQWHPQDYSTVRNKFNRYGERVVFIDLSSALKESGGGGQISFDFLDNEPVAWERFVTT